MSTTLSALIPIFSVILLGWALRKFPIFPDDLWRGIETLTYWVLLPALLLLKLGGTDLGDYDVGPMTFALIVSTLAATAGLAILRPFVRLSADRYVVILQGAMRQNTYIGLAIVGTLWGAAGETLAAVGIAAVIPLANTIAVWTLNKELSANPPSLGLLAWRVITTPIIVACVLGIGLNIAGLGLPEMTRIPLELLAAGALPLGLLAVGAGLEFGTLRTGWGAILLSNALKLVAVPLITLAVCRVLSADTVTTGVAVLFAALPSSAASYVLTRQLGGDHRLMAAILTSQVVMAAVTMPLIIDSLGLDRF